eukprot:GHVT01087170.1.p2 GENE.GHVT01087170.1~~GHVT01087170.1.p2  ORF type:complete len:121 (+),score=20.86 GHVT01087170.1:62-424(+)
MRRCVCAHFSWRFMTMELNEISRYYDPTVNPMPLTDSRFRPDQRAYENGDTDAAMEEKLRIEEKQRTAARARANGEEGYTPRWFVRKKNKITGEQCWVFGAEYWDVRNNLKPIGKPADIF